METRGSTRVETSGRATPVTAAARRAVPADQEATLRIPHSTLGPAILEVHRSIVAWAGQVDSDDLISGWASRAGEWPADEPWAFGPPDKAWSLYWMASQLSLAWRCAVTVPA